MNEIEKLEFADLATTPSIVKMNGEYLTNKNYITNPAIARDEEIKKLVIVLLTPEKSALLVGKPGIGKTAIVEGLAYKISRNEVPEVLKDYKIFKIASSALLGTILINGREELVMNVFIEEIKKLKKTIIFIDEIHTLMGGKNAGPMDLANILKPVIDRGDVKVIGATTSIEYNSYIIRDRAFLRRFEKIDVLEPDKETTIKILQESLPKIEKQTGIEFKHKNYVAQQLIESIVEATSEFKRVYGLSAMYPDVAFSVLTQAFSHALFNNKQTVDMLDVFNAIKTSKRIYPDSIVKELDNFSKKFAKQAEKDGVVFPKVTIEDIEKLQDF